VNTISDFNTLKFIILLDRMWGYLEEYLERKIHKILKSISEMIKKDAQTVTAFYQNMLRKKYVIHVKNKTHLRF